MAHHFSEQKTFEFHVDVYSTRRRNEAEHNYREVLYKFLCSLAHFPQGCLRIFTVKCSSTILAFFFVTKIKDCMLMQSITWIVQVYFFTTPHALWQENNCLIFLSITTKYKLVAYQKSLLAECITLWTVKSIKHNNIVFCYLLVVTSF